MSPEEAREIDRLEFEADCRAVRERALQVIAERHGTERARVLRWFMNDAPREAFNPSVPIKPVPQVVANREPRKAGNRGARSAHGLTMSLRQWADHLGISLNTLHQRIHKQGSLEGAIALGGPRKPGRQPGVAQNLPAIEGTGGGSLAQDSSEIEIFQ